MAKQTRFEKHMNICGVDSVEAALKAARIPKPGEPYPGAPALLVDSKPEVEKVSEDLYRVTCWCKDRPTSQDRPVGQLQRPAALAV